MFDTPIKRRLILTNQLEQKSKYIIICDNNNIANEARYALLSSFTGTSCNMSFQVLVSRASLGTEKP